MESSFKWYFLLIFLIYNFLESFEGDLELKTNFSRYFDEHNALLRAFYGRNLRRLGHSNRGIRRC